MSFPAAMIFLELLLVGTIQAQIVFQNR